MDELQPKEEFWPTKADALGLLGVCINCTNKILEQEPLLNWEDAVQLVDIKTGCQPGHLVKPINR